MKAIGLTGALLAALFVELGAGAAEPSKAECIATNEAAQGLQRRGQLRAAHDKLAVCVSTACPKIVREDCAERLVATEKSMPTILLAASAPDGSDLAAVRVTLDGEPFAQELSGRTLMADPGEHTFVFEAPDLGSVVRKVVLREAERGRRIDAHFSRDAVTPPSRETSTVAGTSASTWGTGWLTWTMLGIGAAGLTVGTIYVVAAVNQEATLSRECTLTGGGCDSSAITSAALQNQQNLLLENQIVAGVGLGIGALSTGVAVYLLLRTGGGGTGPTTAVISPRLGPGWVGIDGSF